MSKKPITYDVNLDLIRIIAVFLVISVHFFLNNGFYQQKVLGNEMYFMSLMRTLFMTCVPLFLLLTGYLMSPKNYFPIKFSYFHHITKVVGIYVITTIFILLFQEFYLHKNLSFSNLLLNITAYQQYSWYVNMYIGLALLVPYLNIIWHNLEDRKNELVLLGIMAVLTIVPTIANIYDFSMIHKGLSAMKKTNQLFPNWWVNLYPLTYFFIGAFLQKNNIENKISTIKLLFLLLLCVCIFGTYNYYRSYGNIFVWGIWNRWGSFQNTIDSVLLFLLLKKIPLNTLPLSLKLIIHKIADLSFGIYLSSWILDQLVYKYLNSHVPVMQDRVFYYFPAVFCVFIGALIISYLVSIIYKVFVGVFTNIIIKNE